MAGATAIHSIGGYEALAVAVVMQARKDSKQGNEKAQQWVSTVAPWVLGMVFDDLDTHYIDAYLRRT